MTAAIRTRPVPFVSSLYFATGYIALPLAFTAIAVAPARAGGFFYHPRLIGIVHLVTLGWITSLLLGSLFARVAGLRSDLFRVRRSDYWAFASFAIGIIGMVAHFWIEEFGGMAWSGAMVLVTLLHAGSRLVPPLWRAADARACRVHVLLAFLNVGVAASAGVVLGFDKVHHFLPGYVIANVMAHAHLAAIGWAAMLATGLAFGAKAPSAWLLQASALGLFTGLAIQSPVVSLIAVACAGAAFVRARLATAPLAYALVTVVIGALLLVLPASDVTMRLALVYGVTGLLGFLAQLVFSVQAAAEPRLAAGRLVHALWAFAVPVMAAGFFTHVTWLLAAGAWLGFAAAVAPASAALSRWIWQPRSLSWARHDRRRRDPRQLSLP